MVKTAKTNRTVFFAAYRILSVGEFSAAAE